MSEPESIPLSTVTAPDTGAGFRLPRPGETVWIRQDRHTDRLTHEAHEEAVVAYQAARQAREEQLATPPGPGAPPTLVPLPPEPPEENPAPKSTRPLPAIVFQVHDSGAVDAHVFHGKRGIGFRELVPHGFDEGSWCWPDEV